MAANPALDNLVEAVIKDLVDPTSVSFVVNKNMPERTYQLIRLPGGQTLDVTQSQVHLDVWTTTTPDGWNVEHHGLDAVVLHVVNWLTS